MPHLILELALWTLAAFVIGCTIGYAVHAMIVGKPAATALQANTEQPEEHDPADEPGGTAPPASAVVEDVLAGRTERPKGIAQARGGKADNLQRISGIGPKNERTLQSLGFFHFDQIAGWSDEEVAWVDDHLKFNGRIIREEWILQAGLLAEGREEEFERLYGGGRRKQQGARGPN
jgi:NADH-quinone oxidoreductase subunit E